VVASGFTLHNFIRGYRTSLIKQIFRVIKPGGLFVNADKYSLEGQEMFDELVMQLERFFKAFVPLGKIDLLREWVLHNVADQAPDRVMKERDALEEMKEIGFEDVKVHFRHGLEAVVSGKKSKIQN
jgi:ubiquinone/menaquinone biosynthesis C-methylase UbiE